MKSPLFKGVATASALSCVLGLLGATGAAFLRFRGAVPDRGAAPLDAAVTGATGVSNAGSGSEDEPPFPWDAPGACWRLRVKQYTFTSGLAVYHPPKVQLEMNVDVLVLPPRHLGDRKIVRLQFTPSAPENREQMPSFGTIKNQKWVLELDRAGGQVEGVRTQDPDLRHFAYPAMPFQEVMNLRTTLYGFPVNWMTQATDVAVVPPARQERRFTGPHEEAVESFEPTRVPAGLDGRGKEVDAVKVTFQESSWDQVMYKLEQTWVPGEPWWRGYKQWDNASIRLEAVRVEDK